MRIIIVIGDQKRELSGRAAVCTALLVAHADRINGMRLGRLEFQLGTEENDVGPAIYEPLADAATLFGGK